MGILAEGGWVRHDRDSDTFALEFDSV